MRNARKKENEKEDLFPANRPPENILPQELSLSFYKGVRNHTQRLLESKIDHFQKMFEFEEKKQEKSWAKVQMLEA